ncbi:MAG: uracil-DNA glycosylase [Bacteroidota bacterium]|nr:uracil-DNA glycosylase [Bacteroidota bacterium]
MDPVIDESWKSLLKDEFNREYFYGLKQFLLSEKGEFTIYPPGSMIFSAFNLTPFDKVRVVILGQDPYHGKGQAHGLCFSVPNAIAKPPSLVNIFKELEEDLGIPFPAHGNLQNWAKQGVLLINATLTVRANQPGSHQKKGWEVFTDTVIRELSIKRSNLIFLLWGNFAQAKQELIDLTRHYVLKAAHPSPFSAHRGFFGCRHFSKTNEILKQLGQAEVNWGLD